MRFRRLLRLLLSVVAIAGITAGNARAQPVPEHELKAAFIYNFIQYTQWPKEGAQATTLNVCANAGSALFPALQGLAGKFANGRVIVLHPLSEPAAETCHVVVAVDADRPRLPQIRRLAEAGAVLTVGDDPEFGREGLMINMTVQSGKISFVVDNTRASQAGLHISSRLLRLARSVQ